MRIPDPLVTIPEEGDPDQPRHDDESFGGPDIDLMLETLEAELASVISPEELQHELRGDLGIADSLRLAQ